MRVTDSPPPSGKKKGKKSGDSSRKRPTKTKVSVKKQLLRQQLNYSHSRSPPLDVPTPLLGPNRRVRLVYLAVAFSFLLWVFYLGRAGQSTFEFLHRGAKDTLKNVVKWESAATKLRQIESPGDLSPVFRDPRRTQRLQDFTVLGEEEGTDTGMVGVKRQQGTNDGQQEASSGSGQSVAVPVTEAPALPVTAEPVESLEIRTVKELKAFYRSRMLPGKVANAESLVRATAKRPKKLLAAIVKRYGNVHESFPVLREWIREVGETPIRTSEPQQQQQPQPTAAPEMDQTDRPIRTLRNTGRGDGNGRGDGTGRGGVRQRVNKVEALEVVVTRAEDVKKLVKGSSVQAANDIKVGNSVIIHKMSPGVVAEVVSGRKYRVRFLGEFGPKKPILLLVSEEDLEVISY